MEKAAFDELKRRAAERWPDMARYMDTARLEDLHWWNVEEKRWQKSRAITVVVFERNPDDQTIRSERPNARFIVGPH